MNLPAFLKTSGDQQADRRYDYATQMIEEGDLEAALDLLLQILEIAPTWPVLPFTIGGVLEKLNRPAEALAYYNMTLNLDPADHQGAALKLQLLNSGQSADMPPAFVATLFDQYAGRFDEHLIQKLKYETPRFIFDLAKKHKPNLNYTRILDLGCGTGLGAEPFAPYSKFIEGIDLSAGMLAQAEQKKIYHKLVHAELVSHLENDTKGFDLIMAVDVLMYLGDLNATLKAIPPRLNPEGIFIFSIQKLGVQEMDFRLDETHRYSHNDEYVQTTLKNAGLSVVEKQNSILRQDRGQDVEGLIYLCNGTF